MPPVLYLPFLENTNLTSNELIEQYFRNGFSNLEILYALICIHKVTISLSHLKRKLKSFGLRRRFKRCNLPPIEYVIAAVKAEIQNSGSCIGHRAMWRRLIVDHGIRNPRSQILDIMRMVDPEGVALRKRRRLKRRKYICPGPNATWHVDGYDKLKPFGFCIHGCIDGFSRRILWLRVGQSNNNPAVISTYYLETLKQLGLAPARVRCDLGTENSTLRLLQRFFHYNQTDPEACLKTFIYGKSTSNQRIEAFWSILRRQGVNWWINLFKDMRALNIFKDANHIHRECLKFCFMDLIQRELDRISRHWNLHLISQNRQTELPAGKPDVMYFTPQLYDVRDHGSAVNREDVDACLELYGAAEQHHQPCSQIFVQLASLLFPNLTMPDSVEEALDLFLQITDAVDDYQYVE